MASRNVERVPSWLGRFSTEFAGAIKAALLPELQEHTKLLTRHSDQLDRHEQTLQAIITVLREQAVTLHEHNDRLARLETRTESLERSMEQGFRLLSERTESLERSMDQGFRLLSERTESLERSMEQGLRLSSERMDQSFRLLSDRIGDLSERVGFLAEQVRDNLELRDRVTKIEARLGMTPNS
jgi:ABC-type transporter Mla subunit MlaD